MQMAGGRPFMLIIFVWLTVTVARQAIRETFICLVTTTNVLGCHSDEIIKVINSTFGSRPEWKNHFYGCEGGKVSSCSQTVDITDYVAKRCNDKENCHVIYHQNAIGVDPCPGESKITQIWHECIPKECTTNGHKKYVGVSTLQPGPCIKCFNEKCELFKRPFDFPWYRFVTLDDMEARVPTSCPHLNKCVSYAPFWLNSSGQPPLSRTEVVTTACFEFESGCCDLKASVTIRNCSNFLVYQPWVTPGCFQYCTSVNIVSPNPIVIGQPMEVKCSVPTIGGIQKLKGITDSWPITTLRLYQVTQTGTQQIAQFNSTQPGFNMSGVNKGDVITGGGKGAGFRYLYRNALTVYLAMRVKEAQLEHAKEYTCGIEYLSKKGHKRMEVFPQTPTAKYPDKDNKDKGENDRPRPAWHYVTAVFLLLLVAALLTALFAVYKYPERCSGAVGKKRKRKRRVEDEDEDDEDTTDSDDEEENQGHGGLKNKVKGRAKSIGGLRRLTSKDGQSTSKTGGSSKSSRKKSSDRKKSGFDPPPGRDTRSEFVPSKIQRSKSAPDVSSTSTDSSFVTRYY